MTHYQDQAWSGETVGSFSFLDRQCKAYVSHKLAKVDIKINGTRPHDIVVHNPAVYRRVLLGGSLKFGEGYQSGDWSCQDLPGMCRRLRTIQLPTVTKLPNLWLRLKSAFLNLQSKIRAQKNVEEHYDLGNHFYRSMLDPSMQYSCAYFDSGATTLAQAQQDKMRLIGEKLQLTPGMRVLDIGCGWGGLAAFLAKYFEVTVVGITLSTQQLEYNLKTYAKEIEAGTLQFHLMDYRDAPAKLGLFDRVVSVGMIEHVGRRDNLETFRDKVLACLKKKGIAVIHGITGSGRADPWINRYIFPGGVLQKLSVLQEVFSQKGLKIWDTHRFGMSYARTLLYWRENFLTAWPVLQRQLPRHPKYVGNYEAPEYKTWFKRTWQYYLDVSNGSFKGGFIDLTQIVISRNPRPENYQPVR